MGKAGRIACIFLPFALTVASFVCLCFVQAGGWQRGSSELNSLYFFQANFTNLTVSGASKVANSTTLTAALQLAKSQHALANIYEIHLWNYCTSNSTDGAIDKCSKTAANFVFDPIDVWQLNSTNLTSSAPTTAKGSPIYSEINTIKGDAEKLENALLGDSGRKVLSAYRKVAKWMFVAYEISFYTTLATLVVSLLAICSRWGSFFTSILSVASTLFTFAAVLTSTVLYAALVGALKGVLDPYGVSVKLGTKAMALGWVSVVASVAATLFWLFSICCCSGKSNPHHRSNKGGLWNAEPKGRGYYGGDRGRGSVRVEKTGGYERVASPFLGHHDDHQHPQQPQADRVPLYQYPPAQMAPYEPYRHS